MAGPLFTILVIALALFAIVGVMVVVLREKRPHDAHLTYVRSPWNEEPAPAHSDVIHDEPTLAEALVTPLVPEGDPAAHTPVTDDAAPDEPKA